MKQHENIKTSSFAKASEDKQKSKILKFVFFVVVFIFLTSNLISSQTVSPIYFQIVNNDKKAVIGFLEKIKTFPEFQKILEMNKNIYGKTVEEETFRQENDKKIMINNLEQKLLINPRARDVLYGLYQLYSSEGNTKMAEKYLEQAREIDPAIGL